MGLSSLGISCNHDGPGKRDGPEGNWMKRSIVKSCIRLHPRDEEERNDTNIGHSSAVGNHVNPESHAISLKAAQVPNSFAKSKCSEACAICGHMRNAASSHSKRDINCQKHCATWRVDWEELVGKNMSNKVLPVLPSVMQSSCTS